MKSDSEFFSSLRVVGAIVRACVALVIVSISTSFAAGKTIKIFSSFDTPGYNEGCETLIGGEQGEVCADASGYEIELAEAIFVSQGYSVVWGKKAWGDIVTDLSSPSWDKDYVYIASIEGREERRANWLFASAVEFEASHYFFSQKNSTFATGTVIDTGTGKSVPNFILDIPENRVQGKKLRVATWAGSAFEDELSRVFVNPQHIEILPLEDGDPIQWLKDDLADVVYTFASGPKNSYTDKGYSLVGGPIANFDTDRFAGTSPALPMNSFGQDINRIWLDGFAAILKDDRFFSISMKWFGRVSWPFGLNDFLVTDLDEFRRRIIEFEAQ